MSNRNCVNCGAPFYIELNKCPYCGTSYFDKSCLDLDSGKPYALKIKTKINGKNCFITQMVRPLINLSIEFSQDYSVKTNLSLEAITLPNQKEILRIEVED